MDILGQYEKQHPEIFHDQPKSQLPSGTSFLIRLVMRLSGGTIHDVNKANIVLVVIATLIVILAVAILLISSGPAGPKEFSNKELQQHVQDYKKVFPF